MIEYAGGCAVLLVKEKITWSTQASPVRSTLVSSTGPDGAGLFTGVVGTGTAWQGSGVVGNTSVTGVLLDVDDEGTLVDAFTCTVAPGVVFLWSPPQPDNESTTPHTAATIVEKRTAPSFHPGR